MDERVTISLPATWVNTILDLIRDDMATKANHMEARLIGGDVESASDLANDRATLRRMFGALNGALHDATGEYHKGRA